MKKITSKRGTIKQILNRKHTYRVTEYARKASVITGRTVLVKEILASLSRMQKDGQLLFSVVNSTHVVGFTLSNAA